MKRTFYATYDNLAGQFFTPVPMKNDACALRNFRDTANNPNVESIYNNPQDYDLYKLYEFDDETGEVTSVKEKLVNGKAVKNEN